MTLQNVFPRTPMNDAGERLRGNAVLRSESLASTPRVIQPPLGPYLPYVVIGQHMAALFASTRATLIRHVGLVLGAGSSAEMVWIATRRVVAQMHHKQAVRYRAIKEGVRDSVRLHALSSGPAEQDRIVTARILGSTGIDPATELLAQARLNNAVPRLSIGTNRLIQLGAMAANKPARLALRVTVFAVNVIANRRLLSTSTLAVHTPHFIKVDTQIRKAVA